MAKFKNTSHTQNSKKILSYSVSVLNYLKIVKKTLLFHLERLSSYCHISYTNVQLIGHNSAQLTNSIRKVSIHSSSEGIKNGTETKREKKVLDLFKKRKQ